jgi:hypothetical protein
MSRTPPLDPPLSLGEVTAWVLDETRTLDELVSVSGLIKGRCEDSSFAGQTRKSFEDVEDEASKLEQEKFGTK